MENILDRNEKKRPDYSDSDSDVLHIPPDRVSENPLQKTHLEFERRSSANIEPLMLAGISFFAGFLVTSGRWNQVAHVGKNLFGHLSTLASSYATIALKEASEQMKQNLNPSQGEIRTRAAL